MTPHTYTRTQAAAGGAAAAAGGGGGAAAAAGGGGGGGAAPRYAYAVANKRLTVEAGDFYIAYRPFCRLCRIVSHPTSSCPRRPARAGPMAPRQLPPGAVWPLPAAVAAPPPPPPQRDRPPLPQPEPRRQRHA